jgi:ElaB/YqjD/DUF883 family membrane-anchored ribosome-binding protein
MTTPSMPGTGATKRVSAQARGAVRTAAGAGAHEVSSLIADVEDLVAGIGEAIDPELSRLKSRVKDTVDSTKQAIADGVSTVQDQARAALSASDDYVREQPWQAIGITALAGFLIGFLAGRR